MAQNSYRNNFDEYDQEYLIIFDQESNDFFYHYFMQQDNFEALDKKSPTNDKKITIKSLKYHHVNGQDIQICQKQSNPSIELKSQSLNTVLDFNSSIQRKDDIKNNGFNKIQLMSPEPLNPNECLNSLIKFKRTKRKYERKNINNKNYFLNIHRDSQQTQLELKNTELLRKRAQNNRKGKHSQSKTQKFIHFMTQYHYSKNFNQYFRKKIIEKVADINIYQTLNSKAKVEIIDQIIPELQQYQMSIHYNVQKNLFLQRFPNDQLTLIKSLFHEVIRKTYRIKFQLEKKSLLNNDLCLNKKHRKFFEEKGEEDFNNIFQLTLKKEPFLSGLKVSFFDSLFKQVSNHE